MEEATGTWREARGEKSNLQPSCCETTELTTAPRQVTKNKKQAAISAPGGRILLTLTHIHQQKFDFIRYVL